MNTRFHKFCFVFISASLLLGCSSGGGGNRLPVAAFSATPSVGLAPMDVALDASSSTDSDGSITQYAWDFGDGQIGAGATVTHTYPNADTYTITLTVTDNQGAQGIETTNVTSTIGISGTITVSTGSAIDSDVNDPFAPYASNNTFNTAQAISNPVILGGFVTTFLTGINPTKTNQDRFASSSDRYDYYRVTAGINQKIILYISDYDSQNSEAIDLDLRLYDVNDTSRAVQPTATSTAAVETFTVPVTGEYFIEVDAFKGASKYILTVGQPVTSAAFGRLSLEDEFVPGDLLVTFNQQIVPLVSGVVTDSYVATLGLTRIYGGPGQPHLMRLGDVTERPKTLRLLGIQQTPAATTLQGFMNDEMKLKLDTIRVVQTLRGRRDVIAADLNYIRRAHAIPNDVEYAKQWHYPLIQLPSAWDVTQGSFGVIVAVLDTGVFMGHTDLATNLLPNGPGGGYDFISNTTVSNDGNGIDPDPDDPGDNSNPALSTFHGTHVAGTVSSDTNNITGVAGVGRTTRIMPIRVLGVGESGNSNDIIQGALYAAGLPNSSNTIPTQKADIINMSFGGFGFSQNEQTVIDNIRAAGVFVVASAGNGKNNTPLYPASYNGVISVSAVDRNKQRAFYSSFGPTVDVAAPGGDMTTGTQNGILSTLVTTAGGNRTSSYGYYQGTSMAAPHIAGVIALMKAAYPGLTPAIFDSMLTSGSITEDLANNGIATRDDNFGYGLIDAAKAATKAVEQAGGIPPAILVANPSSLNFGSSQVELTLVTSNAGGGSLSITSFGDNAAWLSVVPASVDANQLGTYTATVNRNGLVDGIYSANITFNANTNNNISSTLAVPVSIQVGSNASIADDAGFHWILLVDPVTGESVRTVNASSLGGIYNYIFSSVPQGSYYVIAGTDSDNDEFICDEGEACGGYPTRNQLTPLNLSNSSFQNIDFVTGFNVNLGVTANDATQIPREGFRRTIESPGTK